MPARDFRDLIAWQKAMEIVVLVYKDSRNFPNEERFGLTRQLRESSVSIPSNIAEGQGRGSKIEFERFLKIALGSRNEAITQILVARELNYLPEPLTNELITKAEEVGRLINGLINSLSTNN